MREKGVSMLCSFCVNILTPCAYFARMNVYVMMSASTIADVAESSRKHSRVLTRLISVHAGVPVGLLLLVI